MRNWEKWVREQLDLPAMTDGRDERIAGELAAHLEDIWREARARGATEAEADAVACAALGDRVRAAGELREAERRHATAETVRQVERVEEKLRGKGRSWMALADVIRDLRLGLRSLARRPAFSIVVVLVLGLGIGATTAVFALVDAVLLSPLPFRDADRLVTFSHAAPSAGEDDVGQCAAWHFTYQDENHVFDELGMYSPGGGMSLATVTGSGEPEVVEAMTATAGVFRALRMPALLGQAFRPEDENPDGPLVILLGHRYWQARFGGDRAIVGRTLRVNDRPREIIGVLPPSFRSIGQDPAVVMPLRVRRAGLFVGNVGYRGIARLKNGVTKQRAEADMARMLPLALEKFPGGPVFEVMKGRRYVPTVTVLKDDLVGGLRRLLWVLLAGVILVLLIACANVANLFLVRADSRQREMALRAAMGATRWRIGWEYLKESLLLGVLGGLVGFGLAWAGVRALVATAPVQLPRLDEVSLDPAVLIFSFALSVGAGLLSGVVPALRHVRRAVIDTLRQAGHGGTSGRSWRRLQQVIAASQAALTLVVLVALGLVFRSAMALEHVDPGFRHAEDVLAFRLTIPGRAAGSADEMARLQETIARRVRAVAGVTAAGMATALPMHVGMNINPLYAEGITVPGTPPVTRRHKWVGEGYFETLGIPLLAGRAFTWQDVHDRVAAVVVSESLARIYWGSIQAAIGKRVSVRPDPVRWYEVVGVAGDVREDGVGSDPVPMVYWPQVTVAFWQGTTSQDLLVWQSASYAVRSTRVGTPDFVREIRKAVWDVNPNLALVGVGRLSDFVKATRARTTFTLRLFGVAGVIALVLGLVGVYGVISYGVSQRTFELGIRIALGAEGGRVTRMVLRQGFVLAGGGILVGLGLSLLMTRTMSALLFGVKANDPVTFVAVAAAVMAVTLVACYVPARRAARVDPLTALRTE